MKLHALSAAVCAALLAVGPAAAQTQDQIDAARAEAAQYTDAELLAQIRQGMDGEAPEYFRLLRQSFPDEVAELEATMLRETRAGRLHGRQAAELGYNFARELSLKHRPELGNAPLDEVVMTLGAQLETLKVLRQYNLVACAELGEIGGLSLESAASLPAPASDAMKSFALRQMKAMLAARQRPARHGVLTQEDLDRILKAYERSGGRLDVLGAMGDATSPFSPAERCESSIVLMQVVLDQPRPIMGRFWRFLAEPPEELPRGA